MPHNGRILKGLHREYANGGVSEEFGHDPRNGQILKGLHRELAIGGVSQEFGP